MLSDARHRDEIDDRTDDRGRLRVPDGQGQGPRCPFLRSRRGSDVPAIRPRRPELALRSDNETIVSELGSCLRIIECEPQTPRLVSKELEEDRIFDLWAVAQNHIWRAWMIETDPANLQPKLRPLNRKSAEFIRANAPPDIEAARITQALDVLESPWPRREEIMLREWYEDETRNGAAKSAYLIDKILETGLEPFREPPTLAPIRVDEIELVCWLALSPAE